MLKACYMWCMSTRTRIVRLQKKQKVVRCCDAPHVIREPCVLTSTVNNG